MQTENMQAVENTAQNQNGIKKYVPIFEIISFTILLLYALSLLVPMLWSLMTSFKTNDDFTYYPLSFPSVFKWENYLTVFEYFYAPSKQAVGEPILVGVDVMLLNSLWYALGTSLISTFVSFLVGYVVARFKFQFCEVIYTVVILQMVIPTVGTLPSELKIAQDLGIYNTIHGMLFMKSYVTGLYFLSFYAALRVIPQDYAEAAYLDGADNFHVMFKIMLPMASGVFFTILLLSFIQFWNDYQTPLIYMPSFPTLAFGLYHFVNASYEAETSSVPLQLGGCMMMAIPLFAIFIAFQDKLLGGVSLGGLK